MNNKGQSLVLFVLCIPILIGSIVLVVDVGRVLTEKTSINNKIELVIDYSLDSKNREYDLANLVQYNLGGYSNYFEVNDEVISVTTKTSVKGIFSNVFGFSGFDIESKYQGYMKDDKKIIEKVR